MSDVILRMSLAHASTLGVAARAVADTAGSLGLGPVERTQLEALMSEALTAVIVDSFEGSEAIDVDVTVSHEPGHLEIVLQQHGAPSTYVSGQLPERLETLLRLGYADSMQFVSDGVLGSELKVSRILSTGALIDDAEFIAATESAEEPIDVDALEIRALTADDAIEVARLYFRTYGYTKIGSAWIYEPDVFRHKLESGQHLGTIAVTPSGRVIGHTGVLRPSATSPSASAGPLAVDPAYRRLGISERLTNALLVRLPPLNLRGIYAECVTAHPASQKAGLKAGGHETGLVLGKQPAELDFLGFDGPKGFRRAVMVLYTSFGNSTSEESHVPHLYSDMAQRILERINVPRKIIAETARLPEDLPAQSQFTTDLQAATKYAQIHVVGYGADFVEALQGLIVRFAREQFEVITVHLPLANPLTSYFGAGLGELGLSFNAIFPEQEGGDQLLLGTTIADQDPETIAIASEWGEELRAFVVGDRDRVVKARDSRARSRASMARVLDSL